MRLSRAVIAFVAALALGALAPAEQAASARSARPALVLQVVGKPQTTPTDTVGISLSTTARVTAKVYAPKRKRGQHVGATRLTAGKHTFALRLARVRPGRYGLVLTARGARGSTVRAATRLVVPTLRQRRADLEAYKRAIAEQERQRATATAEHNRRREAAAAAEKARLERAAAEEQRLVAEREAATRLDIRLLTSADEAAVIGVLKDAASFNLSPARFTVYLNRPQRVLVGAVIGGKVVGVIITSRLNPEQTSGDPDVIARKNAYPPWKDLKTTPQYVSWVATDPGYQRRGIAAKMFQRLFSEIRDRPSWLEVKTLNAPAVKLYAGLGYVRVGTPITDYYGGTEDGNIMFRNGVDAP